MRDHCIHKPDICLGTLIRHYFHKEGILRRTFRCRTCGRDIRFVYKPVYRLLDAMIWVLLLAFMLLVRLYRDDAAKTMTLWLYILIAVAAVSLIGIVLDMTKEWFLLKKGRFEWINPEHVPEDPVKDGGPKTNEG